jgi:hypothetical protein
VLEGKIGRAVADLSADAAAAPRHPKFGPVENTRPGDAKGASVSWGWDLAKGDHLVQVCVKGSSCSTPFAFHWKGLKRPMCP